LANGASHGLSGILGCVGVHVTLLAGAIGLLFLQRYIWLLGIAEQGYGPYQTVAQVTGISAFFIVIDVLIVWWALRGSRIERKLSMLWPALFFGSALLILVANNA
jgi:hypothetical protein